MRYVGMHVVVRRQPQVLGLGTFHPSFAERSILGLHFTIWATWLGSELPGSTCLCFLSGLCWGYRHIPPTHAFHMGSVDHSSDPHTYTASASPAKSFPQPRNSLKCYTTHPVSRTAILREAYPYLACQPASKVLYLFLLFFIGD